MQPVAGQLSPMQTPGQDLQAGGVLLGNSNSEGGSERSGLGRGRKSSAWQ